MTCKKLDPRRIEHFIKRFKQRLGDTISLDFFCKMVLKNIENGLVHKDHKHRGKEGDRYHTYVLLDDKKYVVVFEKTPYCNLLITIFPD